MARDVKEHAKDKDGLAKHIEKLESETAKSFAAAKAALKGDSHDKAMDAVTEATRASPYGMAHVFVVVTAILVIALAVAVLI